MADICSLQDLYRGFFITEPKGNNAFSYERRQHRSLYVAPLVRGTWKDTAVGHEIVFDDIDDGAERPCVGLARFVYWERQGQHVFVFDNHQHAFMFWFWGVRIGVIEPGGRLIHVDQHKDTRVPARGIDLAGPGASWAEVFRYVNEELNVGNFIPPALKNGLFSEVVFIDSSSAFDRTVAPAAAVDIDLDIFSLPMEYIDEAKKMRVIRDLLKEARLVTIATSPFFMDQAKGVTIIQRLFGTGGMDD